MRIECQREGGERRYIIPGPLDRSSVAAVDMVLADRALFPEKNFGAEEKVIIDLSPLEELDPQGAGALLKLCAHIFGLLPSENKSEGESEAQKKLTLLYKARQIGMLLNFCQFDSICNLVRKEN